MGLPQLSETIYTPSLPDIARALQTSESMAEYTLTIFLFGFAIGILFWGRLSDKVGRKPCVFGGIFIFILGSIGCYLSGSITGLMISRFIQAFGGSIGSVLGQAICRDAFHGSALGKAYSLTGSALAFFPAIGPIVGGLIAENFGWPTIFLSLIAFALILSVLVARYLPETHLGDDRKPISILKVALSLVKDKKIIGLGVIVAACNGISFSYFAEGSFYLIKLLGLSPSGYGSSFILIAVSTMLGGMTSKRLLEYHPPKTIMKYGLFIIFFISALFGGFVLCSTYISLLPRNWMVAITIIAQMGIMFGICMATSNALAIALTDYKWCIGTASSLFGFFYYCLTSLVTLGMGYLHNGTLLIMPLYFFVISTLMLAVQRGWLRDKIT